MDRGSGSERRAGLGRGNQGSKPLDKSSGIILQVGWTGGSGSERRAGMGRGNQGSELLDKSSGMILQVGWTGGSGSSTGLVLSQECELEVNAEMGIW